MTETNWPPMSGGEFDRDVETRMSPDALDRAWAEPAAQILPVAAGKVAVRSDELGLHVSLQPVQGERSQQHIFLGRLRGAPIFASVGGATTDAVTAAQTVWASPFEVGYELSAVEAELVGVGLALTHWHTAMGYSPRDGTLTEITQGGWSRKDASGGEHFPRLDPVVIVLVEHENRLLLGSNALWESGRFSLLAGYIEAGESAEQAVFREIQEESGVRVENIRYVTSQPWPFPRSFMLGFRAELVAGDDPDALVPDTTEISELRWFTRQELRDPAVGIQLPGRFSIARWLLDMWVNEGDG